MNQDTPQTNDDLEPFDPFSSEFHETPYALYRRYREIDPVHWGLPSLPTLAGTWYVTRYTDATAALKDPRLVKKRQASTLPADDDRLSGDLADLPRFSHDWILLTDPPDHTRIRGVLHKAIRPYINDPKLPAKIRAIAADLLARVKNRNSFDLIADFAYPLPLIAVCELIGIPSADHGRIRNWSRALCPAFDLKPTIREDPKGARAAREFMGYLRDILADKRRFPQNDLLSTLAARPALLSDDELISNAALILLAGHETTVNLIGTGAYALFSRPALVQTLRDDASLIPAAIEEFLRYDAPAQLTTRYATENLVLGGKNVRRGDQVCILIGAANRDPDEFTDPDMLDIFRTPNRHLSFSQGIHFCLGAHLARIESQLAFEELFKLFSRLRVNLNDVKWRHGINIRGLDSIPVTVAGV